MEKWFLVSQSKFFVIVHWLSPSIFVWFDPELQHHNHPQRHCLTHYRLLIYLPVKDAFQYVKQKPSGADFSRTVSTVPSGCWPGLLWQTASKLTISPCWLQRKDLSSSEFVPQVLSRHMQQLPKHRLNKSDQIASWTFLLSLGEQGASGGTREGTLHLWPEYPQAADSQYRICTQVIICAPLLFQRGELVLKSMNGCRVGPEIVVWKLIKKNNKKNTSKTKWRSGATPWTRITISQSISRTE